LDLHPLMRKNAGCRREKIAAMELLLLLAALAGGFFALTKTSPEFLTRITLRLVRRMSGLTLKQLAIPDFDMPYLEGDPFLEGGKSEALVLIHGFAGDKDNFTPLARHLTDQYRVIIPDLPGFGEASRHPSVTYRMDEQMERLHVFLQKLGVTRLILGANSMGGFIAALYAAKYPDEVSALWLMDPAGTAAAHGTEMLRHFAKTGDFPALARDESAKRRVIKATMSRPPYIPGFVQTSLLRRAIADFALHSAILNDLLHHSPTLESQIKTLATPALIVWGAEDKVLNPAGAKVMQSLLPNSKIIMMTGIGHLPMLEAPGETATAFLDWVKARR
jgi:pimeloyl-ACP methyl ester carboxylesterase